MSQKNSWVMSNKSGRILFTVYSLFFLILGLFLLILNVNVGGEVQGHEFMWITLSIICAVWAYLYPQFEVNDERAKLIKQKAMFYNYGFIMGYSSIFMILLATEIITLTALQLLGIFTALIASTVFLLFIFFSKRY